MFFLPFVVDMGVLWRGVAAFNRSEGLAGLFRCDREEIATHSTALRAGCLAMTYGPVGCESAKPADWALTGVG